MPHLSNKTKIRTIGPWKRISSQKEWADPGPSDVPSLGSGGTACAWRANCSGCYGVARSVTDKTIATHVLNPAVLNICSAPGSTLVYSFWEQIRFRWLISIIIVLFAR